MTNGESTGLVLVTLYREKMTMKTCSKCKVEQSDKEYYERKDRKSGKVSWCKTCNYKYKVWHQMMSRCYNPKNPSYKHYWGRGITVCKDWLTFKGMEPFIEHHWEKGLQLDRIDNDKGYSPQNCRFVTPSENTNNRRPFGAIKYHGVSFNKNNKKYSSGTSVNGKSTIANLVFKESITISTDDFFIVSDIGEYNWDKNKLQDAHDWCVDKVEQALRWDTEHKYVVVHNTSCTEKEVEKYHNIAKMFNVKFYSLVVEKRHNKENVHDIPQKTIEKQYNRLKNSIKLK